MRFYCAWKLTSGVCNLIGFGFSGPSSDGKRIDEWGRGDNVDIVGFELASNPRNLLAAWNKKTAAWLRRFTYLRMVQPNGSRKPGAAAALATFIVSAFWHGFRLSVTFFKIISA
jgi:hypothetical protein